MLRLSRLFRKGLSNRYGIILLLVLISLAISFLTRVALLLHSAAGFHWSLVNIIGVFGIGLFYDLAVCSYLIIPFVLHVWLTNEKSYAPGWRWVVGGIYVAIILIFLFTHVLPTEYNEDLVKAVIGLVILRFLIFVLLAWRGPAFRKKWRLYVLYADFLVVIFLLLFNAVSEWFFWNEFSTRYNFIAVDYLVYTNEVIGNIRESYPVNWIIAAVLAVSAVVVWLVRKPIQWSAGAGMGFGRRTVVALGLFVFPVLTYSFVTNSWKKFSENAYANELAANGFFEFGTAFFNNELDFFKFYRTMPDSAAFRVLREQLAAPNARFVSSDPFDIEREITYPEPEKKMNVVLISVESLSAEYMKAFGSDKNITPHLDSLAQQSLFFTNLYASGTRTVRGLEALTLSIPPTPGESVVKRKHNAGLFSLGSVFQSKGYITQYMYGGYSYFDNMYTFFNGNHYQVIDRAALRPDEIHYANVWGVADEDLFSLAIRTLDKDYAQHKPFFTHIMTVSNHRPFTYPDGRIDIPSARQVRDGAVKYTDYAIWKFIRDASTRPWFNNTMFVIVADHCAGSAGSVELPVTGYHIPLIIYSPAFAPQQVDRLTAQLDIAPTILGLMKFHYRTKFYGQDIFALPSGRERAFISTYEGLGYLRNDRLVIQSPLKQIEEFQPDFKTGDAKKVPFTDSLVQQAIAYYQTASWLLDHHKLQAF